MLGRTTGLFGVLVAVLGLVLGLQTGASAGSKIPAPATGAYLGAFVDPNARWDGIREQETEVARFEQHIGRKLSIDHHYYGWSGSSQAFPAAMDRWDVAHGRIPLISWEGTNLNTIISGSQDSVIRDRARRVKTFGHRVFISWGYEMNGDWNSWSGPANNSPGRHNGPAKFVAAWRRIHHIFAEVGATNATWVWTPNDRDVPSAAWNHWTKYYPGDAYVDWVGVDGYNWGKTKSWSTWTPFWALFRGVYRSYGGHKPIMVVETASSENGGDKAGWISGMWTALEYRFHGIKAVVWTDRGSDWRVETSAASTASFRRMALSPFMRQRKDTTAPYVGDLASSPGGIVATTAALSYRLSEPARISILIRNQSGHVVRTLGGATVVPGQRGLSWNLKNESGHRVAAGVYRWTVRAADPAHNVRRASASITIG